MEHTPRDKHLAINLHIYSRRDYSIVMEENGLADTQQAGREFRQPALAIRGLSKADGKALRKSVDLAGERIRGFLGYRVQTASQAINGKHIQQGADAAGDG